MNKFRAELTGSNQIINRAPDPNALIESMLGQLLGESSWTALKFYIRRRYGLDVTASRIAIEKPEAFENILLDLFGICSATVLKPLLDRMLQEFPMQASVTLRADNNSAAGRHKGLEYKIHGDFAKIMNMMVESHSIKSITASYPDCSHVAAAYTTTDELRELIRSFIWRGKERNQLNVIVLSDGEHAEFQDLIAEENLVHIEQAATMQSSGGIVLLHPKFDIFAKGADGEVDYFGWVQSMIVPIEAMMKHQGKSGINLAGTLTGRMHLQGYDTESSSLEKVWMDLVHGSEHYPLTVLCPYRMPVILNKSIFANHTAGAQCCGSNWLQIL